MQGKRTAEVSVSVRSTMEEIRALGPERAKVFMQGIAAVLSADKEQRIPDSPATKEDQ